MARRPISSPICCPRAPPRPTRHSHRACSSHRRPCAVQLDTRLVILVALGDPSGGDGSAARSASRAFFAIPSRIRAPERHTHRPLLDARSATQLLETLAAATHEQRGARSPPALPDAASTRHLQRAADAWRSCERKREEAAAQARGVSRDLAALRGALGPALASAEAELRELGAQIRHRQRALRSRVRQSERARSRLQAHAGKRQAPRCAEANLPARRARRSRCSMRAWFEPAAPSRHLSRASTRAEREVEAGVAALAGLHAASSTCSNARHARNGACALDLGSREAGARRTGYRRCNAAGLHRSASKRTSRRPPKEIEHWKASRHRSSRRTRSKHAQAGRLASPETGRQEDAALTELRLEASSTQATCAARQPATGPRPQPRVRRAGERNRALLRED